MGTQEPIDLVIMLRIVEYMNRRTGDGPQVDRAEDKAILNFVNNVAAGAALDISLYAEANVVKETVMGDNYQVSGQAGAVGREARAENNTFNQIQTSTGSDLSALAQELQTLRTAMRDQAKTAEEDIAVAEVAQAAVAADQGADDTARSHLARAGEWALTIATSIGTTVAAGAIKSALGL